MARVKYIHQECGQGTSTLDNLQLNTGILSGLLRLSEAPLGGCKSVTCCNMSAQKHQTIHGFGHPTFTRTTTTQQNMTRPMHKLLLAGAVLPEGRLKESNSVSVHKKCQMEKRMSVMTTTNHICSAHSLKVYQKSSSAEVAGNVLMAADICTNHVQKSAQRLVAGSEAQHAHPHHIPSQKLLGPSKLIKPTGLQSPSGII